MHRKVSSYSNNTQENIERHSKSSQGSTSTVFLVTIFLTATSSI